MANEAAIFIVLLLGGGAVAWYVDSLESSGGESSASSSRVSGRSSTGLTEDFKVRFDAWLDVREPTSWSDVEEDWADRLDRESDEVREWMKTRFGEYIGKSLDARREFRDPLPEVLPDDPRSFIREAIDIHEGNIVRFRDPLFEMMGEAYGWDRKHRETVFRWEVWSSLDEDCRDVLVRHRQKYGLDEETSKLERVLERHDCMVQSAAEARFLLQDERAADYHKLKERLEDLDSPDDEEILRTYVEFAGDDSKVLTELLRDVLQELDLRLDATGLQDAVVAMKEEVELEEYEAEVMGKKSGFGQIVNLDELSGAEFETFLGRLFESLRYDVERTPSTGDQGADLIARSPEETVVVQAKRYTGAVGNKAVQEILGAAEYYNADRGLVVTTSTFTGSAEQLAARGGVELWSRDDLIEQVGNSPMDVTLEGE